MDAFFPFAHSPTDRSSGNSFMDRLLTLELIQFHLFNCRSYVDATLEVERMPYTQNTHYLQSSVDKWLAKYKTQRKEENASAMLAFFSDITPRKTNGLDKSDNAKQQYMREALAILARIGYPGLKEEDLGRLNAPDEYQNELDVMAEVRGYFQVAYKVSKPRIAFAIEAYI